MAIQELTRVILEAEGENAELRTITKVKDFITGDLIESTSTKTTISAYFEDISTEERLIYPGVMGEATVRVFILTDVTIKVDDKIARFPDTDDEVEYRILGYTTTKAYKEVRTKEV